MDNSTRLPTLPTLLKKAATTTPRAELVIHPPGGISSPLKLSYLQLLAEARYYSGMIQRQCELDKHRHVILYLDNRRELIVWFWSVLLAGGVPVLCPPLGCDVGHRLQIVKQVCGSLEPLFCITRPELVKVFHGLPELQLYTTNYIESCSRFSHGLPPPWRSSVHNTSSSEVVLIIFSAGETVRYTQEQIISRLREKAATRPIPSSQQCLKLAGSNHEEVLIDFHLLALYLGIDQVHFQDFEPQA
jgi:acyl-CoA synthetase (AMP-forming)/AMP-acid ligase II